MVKHINLYLNIILFSLFYFTTLIIILYNFIYNIIQVYYKIIFKRISVDYIIKEYKIETKGICIPTPYV